MSHKLKPKEIRAQRRSTPRGCADFLIIAPLWVSYQANLGTLLRTCDATGSCMAVPDTNHYKTAVDRGNRLDRRPHVHWTKDKEAWLAEQYHSGAHIVAVELCDDAESLAFTEPVREKTVVLLGHENFGVPEEAFPYVQRSISIPMIGVGSSLNVAVAGSLVLYRLSGLL